MKKYEKCKYPTSIPFVSAGQILKTHEKRLKLTTSRHHSASTWLRKARFWPAPLFAGTGGEMPKIHLECGGWWPPKNCRSLDLEDCILSGDSETPKKWPFQYVLKDVSCSWKKLGYLMIALGVLHWYTFCFQLFPIKKRGWCRFYLQAILQIVWNSWVCLNFIGTKQWQVPLSDACMISTTKFTAVPTNTISVEWAWRCKLMSQIP